MLGWIATGFLKIVRWKTVAEHPREGGFVFTAAPHTSYWDAFYMLAVAAKEGIAIHWLAKDALFRFPFRGLMRWLGGIPVDRTRRTSLVDAAIEAFRERPSLILGISPEGQRSPVEHWKSGFYRIALGAGVPVCPGFLDFGNKVGGAGAPIPMTGDSAVDFARLKAFYENMSGRIPENFDPAAIRPAPA